jgi:predicted GIY-YIG superfamily endonuclease
MAIPSGYSSLIKIGYSWEMLNNRYVLYRMYDDRDRLLYVGATTRLITRLATHEQERPWWDEVTTVRLERFATWEELAEAEKAAIQIENPRHNVSYLKDVPFKPRRPRGTVGVYKRASDGLWVGNVELPRDRDGKRRRRTVASKDRMTAIRKLEDIKAQTGTNQPHERH